MRTISLSMLLLLAVEASCYAATFECEFSPATGQQNGASCQVDTTADLKNAAKCSQNYSATLFAQCAGRAPGGVDQLICYFANPANPPNLNVKDPIELPGVYVSTIEWTGTVPPSAAPVVLDYKDAEGRYWVSCGPLSTTK